MKVEFIIRNDDNFKFFKGFENGTAIFVQNSHFAKTYDADTLFVILSRLERLGFSWLSVKSVNVL